MANPSLNPDLLLARRAAAGQAEAWDELVTSYGPRIYSLAFQFAGRGTDAEDLTQEIFLKLYRSLDQYRGDVPLVAWALRLSRNLCIDQYRKNRRSQSAVAVPAEILETVPVAEEQEKRTLHRQRLEAVYRALDSLSEELAIIVLLHDLQGMPFEETAAVLELPIGTIKSRSHRGRQLLTHRVAELLEPAVRPTALSSLGATAC